jgi:hypothetical protein
MKITKTSQKRFNKHIDRMIELTGADVDKVVRNMGRDFLVIAVKKTPLAKKRAKLYKKIERRDGSIYWKPLGRGVPKGRGFAKAAWLVQMPKVGMTPKSKIPINKDARSKHEFIWRKSNFKSNMELANQVDYIEALDQGDEHNKPRRILARSMSALGRKTEKTLDRLAKKQEREFNR